MAINIRKHNKPFQQKFSNQNVGLLPQNWVLLAGRFSSEKDFKQNLKKTVYFIDAHWLKTPSDVSGNSG